MRTQTVALVATVLAVPFVARAQDAPVRVTEAELNQKASWGDKLGTTVSLENVKFVVYSNPNIDVKNVSRAKLRTSNEKLAGTLPVWRTPGGQELDRKKRSNVRIVGLAKDDDSGERYIDVTDVVKMADDVVVFEAQGKKCTTFESLKALAKEGAARAAANDDPDLRAWSLKAYETALKQKQDALAKDEKYAKAATEVAREFRTLAGNPNLGIALLNSVYGDAATTAADKDAVSKVLLDEFDARLYKGSWISHDDFKKAIGFVLQNGVWVRRERVEFLEEIRKEREKFKEDSNPRKGSAYLYGEASSKGEVVIGMYKTEVVPTKGYGFPDYVDRIEETKSGNTLPWDQWIVPGGTRLYFVNGVLFSIKTKSDPWFTGEPSK